MNQYFVDLRHGKRFSHEPEVATVYPFESSRKIGLPNKGAFNTSNGAHIMKKLILTVLVAVGSLAAQADGYHGYHNYPHHAYVRPSFSFSFGAYPYFSPYPYYSFPAYSYPAYSYSNPGYDSGYGYARPNYAVGGTLLGALAGGLIGSSVHNQGWEGAGIGAAAGLVLGSLAERNARAYEQRVYTAPPVSYNQASYTQPNAIADAPTVNNAPTVPDAPKVSSVSQPASSMSGANSLFGR
jgi:YMGG-like Gly-zipper